MTNWSAQLLSMLLEFGVRHYAYIPDAGNSALLKLIDEDERTTSYMMTAEEEGKALRLYKQ